MVFNIKNQSIKTKIAAGIIISTIFFAILTYFISSTFIIKSYISLEDQEVRTNITRVTNAFDNTVGELKIKMSDWAVWDDTYFFITNRNKDYITSNLANSTLTNMNIHAMIFLDNDENVVYSAAQDLNHEVTSANEILEYIAANKKIFKFTDTKSYISGIVPLKTNDVIVVASPILRNDSTGPINGTLVFVDIIDKDFVDRLSSLTQLNVKLYQYNSELLTEDVILAKNNINIDSDTFVKDLSNTEVAGYYVIYDVKNNPSSIFKITTPRFIYNQGSKTLGVFIWIIIFIIISFGIINIFFINSLFIKRLTNLSKSISEISFSGDVSKRLTEDINDEVGDISIKMNEMLTRLAGSEEVERKTTEELKQQISEIEKLNNLMIDRELKMVELKEEINKLKNKHI